jgi:anti-anti-sigma regulatory factor
MDRLVLSGRVGVEHAAELRDALLVLGKSGAAVVDLSGLEDFDLSLVQVLMAARREFPLTIVPPQKEEARALLHLLGVT